MVRKFSAKHIYTGREVIADKVIVVDTEGHILRIDNIVDHDSSTIEMLSGFICPGFVNAHCHLELSHMKGKVNTGTGLLPFIHNVVSFREIETDTIQEAIVKADEEMYRNGIVAVGDISNKLDTAFVKSSSKLDYYSFVEMFDFLQPSRTDATISQYLPVFEGQSTHNYNKKSFVPHAPYSVSPELFRYINENNSPGQTISIHNQETPAENELFLNGSGKFIDFYKGFGMEMSHFTANGKTSIHYALAQMSPFFKTIFVHNTLTNSDDLRAASEWNADVFWATCPNANLYIENRLPNYQIFLDEGVRVAIGTDSLTSNWQLSIWEEIKTIKKYASYVPLETLIAWGTLHGAQALSYDDRLGSIEVGKSPGLIHIDNEDDIFAAHIQRII